MTMTMNARIVRRLSLRRGITIIETIVLMTGVAAMLGLCVIMLQLLMKLDGDSRARLETAGTLARLAEQFRHDVHGARTARLVEQPAQFSGLQIEPGPDRAIAYQVKGENKVVRVESSKGKVVRSESYDISRGGPIQFAFKEDGGRRFGVLTVNR